MNTTTPDNIPTLYWDIAQPPTMIDITDPFSMKLRRLRDEEFTNVMESKLIAPCRITFPITRYSEFTKTIAFPGGTVYDLLRQIYNYFQQPITSEKLYSLSGKNSIFVRDANVGDKRLTLMGNLARFEGFRKLEDNLYELRLGS